jgi:hypothetical protein
MSETTEKVIGLVQNELHRERNPDPYTKYPHLCSQQGVTDTYNLLRIESLKAPCPSLSVLQWAPCKERVMTRNALEVFHLAHCGQITHCLPCPSPRFITIRNVTTLKLKTNFKFLFISHQ